MSTNFNLVIFQVDVCSALLHGEIEDGVYMYLLSNSFEGVAHILLK